MHIMRIALLHYSKPPVIGGVERVIGEQATALRELGHEVEVLTRKEWRLQDWDAVIVRMAAMPALSWVSLSGCAT
jgi:glycosyltransferase involved in cell wall biosynthesis